MSRSDLQSSNTLGEGGGVLRNYLLIFFFLFDQRVRALHFMANN